MSLGLVDYGLSDEEEEIPTTTVRFTLAQFFGTHHSFPQIFCGLFLEFIGTQNLPQPLLLLGPQTQNKKREREESASDAAETNGKRAKLDDLVLPDFFDVPLNKPPPAPISTLTDEAPMDVDKKSSSPMPQRTASGMIIPPQVRTARPNTVTEDYGAWSTEKKVKKPSVQR